MSNQVEEFLMKVNGTVETLVLAFGALAATHPEKEKVMAIISRVADDQAAASDGDTIQQRAYKTGIRTAVETLAKSVVIAQLASERKDSKRPYGDH